MSSQCISNINGVDGLNFVGVNQDSTCFAVGTSVGFKVNDLLVSDGHKVSSKRTFEAAGGIGIVSMLYRTNILALVGGGRNPKFPKDQVIIWDDHKERPIATIPFKSEVKSVYLKREMIIVVLTNKVYVYNLENLELLDHIETISNPLGLLAVCPRPDVNVFAVPGIVKGHLLIESMSTDKAEATAKKYTKHKGLPIPAHETELAAIAINFEGTRVATASEKGTLIRVFDTETGQQIHELRRGADRAVIYCLTFDRMSQYLACTSDRGTIHIYALRGGGSGDEPSGEGEGTDKAAGDAEPASGNETMKLGFMKGFLPKYFSSEWSYAQIRVTEGRTMCAFLNEASTVAIFAADGTFYKAKFEKGGECEKISYESFTSDLKRIES